MKYAIAILALAAAVTAQTPPGCSTDFSGTFEISPVNGSVSAKRELEERQATQACTNTPVATLKGGILVDQNSRQGGIVANNQFQFDPPGSQPDSIFTSGFSICSNGSLAVGGSAVFYSCKSGGFSNLYNKAIGPQCDPVFLQTSPCSGGSAAQSASIAPSSAGSTTASSSSARPVSSSSATSVVPTTRVPVPTTSASTPASTSVTTRATTSTSATVVPPFPSSGNSTRPASTGSAPATTSTRASSTSPVPFTSGSDAIIAGSKLFLAIAGMAAFALF